MKILLLYPPRGESMQWEDLYYPVLGIGNLASFLQEIGIQASIYYAHDYRLQKVKEVIETFNPAIVGISCDSGNRINCFKIARLIKSINRKILIVLGGVHATLFHKQILEKVRYVDFVVRNEGEVTFKEFINAVESGEDFSSIPGLSYRNRNHIQVNPPRAFINNMDILPMVSYNGLSCDKKNVLRSGRFVFQSSRGCPFCCNFCACTAVWKGSYRAKSVKKVTEELIHLVQSYGIDNFFLADSTANCNTHRLESICRSIIDKGIKIKWGCFARIDKMSLPLLMLMKDAGCEKIFYGVESFSDKMLERMNKGHSKRQAIHILNMTNSLSILTGFSIIFGFPGETEETIAETLVAFKKLQPGIKCCNIGIFEPHPGSPIYSYLESKKMINDELWFTDFKMLDYVSRIHSRSLVTAIKKSVEIIEQSPDQYIGPNEKIETINER